MAITDLELEKATIKVCPICGAEEPLPWFELPMNEEIRAYARAYIAYPKKFYPSLTAALDAWGITIEPEDVSYEHLVKI